MRLSEFHYDGPATYYWHAYIQIRANPATTDTHQLNTLLTQIRSDLVRLKLDNDDSERLFRMARMIEIELAEKTLLDTDPDSMAA